MSTAGPLTIYYDHACPLCREEMMAIRKPVIVDCQVAKLENCFPMVPSGAAHNEILLNAKDAEVCGDATERVLGFKVSDRTKGMVFVRCNDSHHSTAFARAGISSLNHIAFEMEDFDAVMRGNGRLQHGQARAGAFAAHQKARAEGAQAAVFSEHHKGSRITVSGLHQDLTAVQAHCALAVAEFDVHGAGAVQAHQAVVAE